MFTIAVDPVHNGVPVAGPSAPVVNVDAAHNTDNLPPDPWYHCETCDILFHSLVMYLMHAGAHSRHNPLECNVCGKVSSDSYEFVAYLSYSNHCDVSASARA